MRSTAFVLDASFASHGIAHRIDITIFLDRQGVDLPELDI